MSDQVRNKTKRIIVWFVVGAHIAVLLIPGIVYALIEWLKPAKPDIYKVVLTEKIPGEERNPSPDPGGSPEDLPPSPNDVSDIPELPQPKPEPPQPKPISHSHL